MKHMVLLFVALAAISAQAGNKKYDLHCRGYAADGLGDKREVRVYVYSDMDDMRVSIHNRSSGAWDDILANARYSEIEETSKLRLIGKQNGIRRTKVEVVVHLNDPVRMSDRQVANSRAYRTNIFVNGEKVPAVCAVGRGS